ncbi:MAG: hypothetical protein RUMPE_01121 [Eubacteriales bacterium SKADARSKE-1]|nr:hypothetical protein [Eubacteriales bacterium SKADARSKE-1]
MKGIADWTDEIKKNKKFAKKFEGTRTVSEILSLAKESGYEFSEKELRDLDLDLVSGGDLVRVNVISQGASATAVVTGNNSIGDCNPTINQSANIGK